LGVGVDSDGEGEVSEEEGVEEQRGHNVLKSLDDVDAEGSDELPEIRTAFWQTRRQPGKRHRRIVDDSSE